MGLVEEIPVAGDVAAIRVIRDDVDRVGGDGDRVDEGRLLPSAARLVFKGDGSNESAACRPKMALMRADLRCRLVEQNVGNEPADGGLELDTELDLYAFLEGRSANWIRLGEQTRLW